MHTCVMCNVQDLLSNDMPTSRDGCSCSSPTAMVVDFGEAQAQAQLSELEAGFNTGTPTGPVTHEDLRDAMNAGPSQVHPRLPRIPGLLGVSQQCSCKLLRNIR